MKHVFWRFLRAIPFQIHSNTGGISLEPKTISLAIHLNTQNNQHTNTHICTTHHLNHVSPVCVCMQMGPCVCVHANAATTQTRSLAHMPIHRTFSRRIWCVMRCGCCERAKIHFHHTTTRSTIGKRQQLQENHIQHQQSHLRNNNHVIYLFISVYSLLTVLLFYKIKASVHIELCPC